MRMLVLPFRAAPAALRAAATRVAPRAAVAAFPRTTVPVRAFSRQSDLDNHADQCNPNNDEYWNSRDMDNPADEEHDNDNANQPDHDDNHDYDADNHANQCNPNNDEYWQSRGK